MDRRVRAWVVLCVALLGLEVAARPQSGMEPLQGSWVVMAGEHNGIAMDSLNGGVMTIDGAGFEIRTASGNVLAGTLAVDASVNDLGQASLQLHRAVSGRGTTFDYPDTAFGQSLRWTGDMIETVAAAEQGGRSFDVIVGGTLTITDERFALLTATGNEFTGELRIDATTSPRQLDFVHADGTVWEAIYAAAGDFFRLNYIDGGADRPTLFATANDTPGTIVVMRR